MTIAINADVLRARLVSPNGPYAALDVVASTGSTNADLAAAAARAELPAGRSQPGADRPLSPTDRSQPGADPTVAPADGAQPGTDRAASPAGGAWPGADRTVSPAGGARPGADRPASPAGQWQLGTDRTASSAGVARPVADRTVLIADQQTAGQGRQRRSWVSPPGTGLYLSVLLRPEGVPAPALSWIPLLAGVALARTVSWAGAAAMLKWPNDLLLGPAKRKAAGILAEVNAVRDPIVVLGIGLNVRPLPDDVPPGAGGLPPTSLADEGATQLDRTELADRLLTELAELDRAWRLSGGDPEASGLAEEYRRWCGTLGQRVRVELPGPAELIGTAESLQADGTLQVRTDDNTLHPIYAGDVIHLREHP